MNTDQLYQLSEFLIKEILKNNLSKGTKVFLFGSRAMGHYSRSSDIDIGIMPSSNNEESLERKLTQIKEAIDESVIPYKVDIIDFSKVSDKFKVEALKNTIEWKID